MTDLVGYVVDALATSPPVAGSGGIDSVIALYTGAPLVQALLGLLIGAVFVATASAAVRTAADA